MFQPGPGTPNPLSESATAEWLANLHRPIGAQSYRQYAVFPRVDLLGSGWAVVAGPYVTKCNLCQKKTNSVDSQGRAVYQSFGSDRSNPLEFIPAALDIGISANADLGPITFEYNVVDGGGTFDISYYSAYNGFGFPDPNGNTPRGAFGQPNPYQFTIPTTQQHNKYPNLAVGNRTIDSRNASSFFVPQLSPTQAQLATIFPTIPSDVPNIAGVAMGCVYNPGGLDPALQFLHWIQLIGTTSTTWPGGANNNIMSTGAGLIGQFGDVKRVLTAPDGSIYSWFIDNNGNQTDLSYDGVSARGETGAAIFSNTGYFLDTPQVSNPNMPFGVVFFLFKMFYGDGNGGYLVTPSTNPPGGEIFPQILNQGLAYNFLVQRITSPLENRVNFITGNSPGPKFSDDPIFWLGRAIFGSY